jgi:hypothetical protein
MTSKQEAKKMKTKNIIIIILVAVLLGQFFLLIRHTRIQKYMECVSREELPVEVYVAGMAESVKHNYRTNTQLLSQSKWAMRHLGRCVELLEKERELEPIPVKRKRYSFPDSNHPGLLPPIVEDTGPFYVPYEKYKIPDLPKYPEEEVELKNLQVALNMNTLSLKLAIYSADEQIQNYEERLQRLDPNQ